MRKKIDDSPRSGEILRVAANLFRTKGYANTGMRTLAEALEMEAASLYNHLESKDSLLQALCFKIANTFQSHLQKVENDNAEPLKKIEAILRFQIRMMVENFDQVYISHREWKHLPEPARSEYLNLRLQYEKGMAAIIRSGIANGSISNINEQVAVLTLLSAIRGIEYWQRHPGTISAEALEENMVSMLLKSLKQ